jgi:hypothetical protein
MLLCSKWEVQNQRGDQVLYFDKLSHKQEIFLQSGTEFGTRTGALAGTRTGTRT